MKINFKKFMPTSCSSFTRNGTAIIRKSPIIFCLFVFVASQVGPSVSALSQAQKDTIQSGARYFDVEENGGIVPTTCTPGGGVEVGAGPLFGLQFPQVSDINDLISRINTYIKTAVNGSPFNGLGSEFVSMGQKYNVNPAMIVGIAFKEEALGTTRDYSNRVSHNSFGYGQIPGSPVDQYGFAVFPSFSASIGIVTKQISIDYVQPTGQYYSTTILEMMKRYTPPDPEGATAATLAPMHKILDGIATTGGSGGGSSSSCGSVTAILQTIALYAWPDKNGVDSCSAGTDTATCLHVKGRPEYIAAMNKPGAYQGSLNYTGSNIYPGADCGAFVTAVMRDSGADPGYNPSGNPAGQATSGQLDYLSKSPKYKGLGQSTSSDFITKLGLQPGDIAVSPNHTYIYVGSAMKAIVPSWNGAAASASQDTRTGMADIAYTPDDKGVGFTWFRLTQ